MVSSSLQEFADALMDAAILVDADLNVLHYNRAFRHLVELRPRDLAGRKGVCHEILGLTACEDGGCPTRRALASGRTLRIDEVASKDGSRRFNVTSAPLRGPAGELLGVLETYREVTGESRMQATYKTLLETERKQNERLQIQQRELDARNKELERASRLKSEFLANMSHELRTPMNSIIGYTDLVLTRESAQVDPKSRKNLEKVRSNGLHLLELINGVLDLAKIEAGRMELILEGCEIKPTLESTAQMASVLLAGKPVTLVCEIPDRLGPIETDRTKFRQIVLNLLSNACKFTETGEVVLRCEEINGRRAGEADRLLKIQVRDTGIGIAAKDLPFIFDEFHQVDGSATRKYAGTGLGLAIVKKMVALFEGSVAVHSEVGKGTTFTVVLPFRSSRHARGIAPPSAAAPRPPLEGAPKPTVLVMTSEPDTVVLVRESLFGQPFEVLSAFTAEDGLRLAGRTPPLAILLDVGSSRWARIQEIRSSAEKTGTAVVELACVESLGGTLRSLGQALASRT